MSNVSNPPIGPGGIPNPFGFDLEQLMRMLQSQGPVNFEIAQQVAGRGRDREQRDRRARARTADRSRGAREPRRRRARRAGPRSPTRPASARRSASPSECVDRSDVGQRDARRVWRPCSTRSPARCSAATAPALGAGLGRPGHGLDPASGDIGAFLMQSLLPLLLGVWSGSMIGQLAHHALGQYDLPLPLHGPPTQRFLVRNVEAFGEEWSIPADELHYTLALREVVHGAQRSVPWVREELERLATDLRRRVRSATRRAAGTARRPQSRRPVVDGVAHPAR